MMETTILNTWHVVDDVFYHVVQIKKEDGKIYFYTNGKLEHVGDADSYLGVSKDNTPRIAYGRISWNALNVLLIWK